MTNRKKKIKILQILLLMMGLIVIFYTYFNKQKFSREKIISKEIEKKVKNQNTINSENGDIFYNIEYSGFDLAGNRYVLKSKEAVSGEANKEIINMKFVNATFYFKDDTVLYVESGRGIYNNRTLDMKFYENVSADYENSKLFSEFAQYSNSESMLIVNKNVKIIDSRGTMVADKLLLDLKNQTLDITSLNNDTVSTNLFLK
jgi:LPS export ABC transporter protein LptC